MVQRAMSTLCFINKSSNSVRMFSEEVLASDLNSSSTSCSWDSGAGMRAIWAVFSSHGPKDLLRWDLFRKKLQFRRRSELRLGAGIYIYKLYEQNLYRPQFWVSSHPIAGRQPCTQKIRVPQSPGGTSTVHDADKDVTCLTDSGNAVL